MGGRRGLLRPKGCRRVRFLCVALLVAAVLPSCAIRYFDPDTGTEHLFGFGHMRMRVSPESEGVRAIGQSTDMLGLGLGLGSPWFVMAGWNRNTQLRVTNANTKFRLDWPSSDLLEVRVGTEFPVELLNPSDP